MQNVQSNPKPPDGERAFTVLSLLCAAAPLLGAVVAGAGGGAAGLCAASAGVLLLAAGLAEHARGRRAERVTRHARARSRRLLEARAAAPSLAPAPADGAELSGLLEVLLQQIAELSDSTALEAERATSQAVQTAQQALRMHRLAHALAHAADDWLAQVDAAEKAGPEAARDALRAGAAALRARHAALSAMLAQIEGATRAQNETGQALAQAAAQQSGEAQRLRAVVAHAAPVEALRDQVALILRPTPASARQKDEVGV